MPVTNLSPNTDNYYLGRGVVYWRRRDPVTGLLATWRDMGNAPSAQFKATVRNLDHFSSRAGIKIKDKSVPIDANATLVVDLEEWTADNLALAMMGIEGVNPFDVLVSTLLEGQFFILGTNTIGAKLASYFPSVNLTPTGNLDMITGTDKFGVIQLTADLLADPITGSFGQVDWDTLQTVPPP